MTNTSPPREQASAEAKVHINVERGVSAGVQATITYGCPGDPDQCTLLLNTITATAQAQLSAGTRSLVGCDVKVTVRTSAATSGNITVTAMAANSNISVPNSTQTIGSLPANGSQIVTIPFSFLGAVGATGKLNISIAYGGTTKTMPTMEIVLA